VRVCLVPSAVSSAVLGWLDRLADWLVARKISANAVTAGCVGLAFVAGLLLAGGWFAPAAVVMILASLGDALDGMVARRSHTQSAEGALLDASSDRYQEFFLIGGLAIQLRDSTFELAVALLALAGSFMVSYGSAKAEGLGAPVPAGTMRRPERALILCVGVVLTAVSSPIAVHGGLSHSIAVLPVVLALFAIAVVANGSAILRLRMVAENIIDRAPGGAADDPHRPHRRTPFLNLRCPR
jgi:CDP-diacylglycerol--glycerol-3-phosphate 3-phosphatidyltransferase